MGVDKSSSLFRTARRDGREMLEHGRRQMAPELSQVQCYAERYACNPNTLLNILCLICLLPFSITLPYIYCRSAGSPNRSSSRTILCIWSIHGTCPPLRLIGRSFILFEAACSPVSMFQFKHPTADASQQMDHQHGEGGDAVGPKELDILDRLMALPDELKVEIIRRSLRIGIVDTRLLHYAKSSTTGPVLEREVLRPFEKHQRLHQIAAQQFYDAIVFRARVTFYNHGESNSEYILADCEKERANIKHLHLVLPFQATQATIDRTREFNIARQCRSFFNSLPALYPRLRSLRICLKHDPKYTHDPKDTGAKFSYPEQKDEVTVWESGCLLTSLICELRAYTSTDLRGKATILDQVTFWDWVSEITPRPVWVNGRSTGVDDIADNMLDRRLSVALM